MLKGIHNAIGYIESHLRAELDLEEACRLAYMTEDSFARFFSYMTGMSLKEYIRRRRLSLAAEEILLGREKIIDIALSLGYESADAFTRAFTKQHGITPSRLRKEGGGAKLFPPVSFHIIMQGATEMNYRILDIPETKLYGYAKPYDGMGYRNREELRHVMWASDNEDIPGKLCEGTWNQPGNTAYDGVWYGVWQDGCYMIAREEKDIQKEAPESIALPAGKYAAFTTECGGLAWEEFPKLFSLIFESWLPTSPYQQRGDMAIEVLHLWTDHDIRQKKRYYEVWIPVELKE